MLYTYILNRGFLLIPQPILDAVKWKVGDNITIEIVGDSLILSKLESKETNAQST